uniref:Chromo domain-containing protein n=1 Tax=Coccolithus braarudii TaxID=221442 RepID=A0A7S0L963_9EUKA|mmetsp:Transcript_24984/g.53984  ORF Transcript_24984/g.53984 Transcript_24984/m.53984 type:complete len:298 (+) Transcript_24984:295-1188(+)
MAKLLGYQVTPTARVEQHLALAISRRLIPRKGEKLYQVASFTLESFPLGVLYALIPERFETMAAESNVAWSIPTVQPMRNILGPLMSALPNFSAGISRGQQAPSESVIRVLATMMPPLELNWWMPPRGTGRVMINFAYVLVQGIGDLHPPKDPHRREMALSTELVATLRVAALHDAMTMKELGYSLSPAWLRQLGDESRARQTEAQLIALRTNQPTSRKRKLHQATYPIDSIQAERSSGRGMQNLVRWEGYHPYWEAWLAPDFVGEVGDPVETWEPAATLQNTLALQAWEESLASTR